MPEPESRIWKYLELPQVFQQKAGEIDITCKQHLRVCERLAGYLAKQKPKTPKEFDQVEYLKDFVMKSAELNEKTIALLDYFKTQIQEICEDAKTLRDADRITYALREQGAKIEGLIKENDELTRKYYGLRRSKDTTAA